MKGGSGLGIASGQADICQSQKAPGIATSLFAQVEEIVTKNSMWLKNKVEDVTVGVRLLQKAGGDGLFHTGGRLKELRTMVRVCFPYRV